MLSKDLFISYEDDMLYLNTKYRSYVCVFTANSVWPTVFAHEVSKSLSGGVIWYSSRVSPKLLVQINSNVRPMGFMMKRESCDTFEKNLYSHALYKQYPTVGTRDWSDK